MSEPIELHVGPLNLGAQLRLPEKAIGLVVFVHGSGSGRLSPRNQEVAAAMNAQGLGTLLFDLLTDAESRDRARVFDIEGLSARCIHVIDTLKRDEQLRHYPLILFGASTGAAAALVAAAERPHWVRAVVSRGGRVDLAQAWLTQVRAPTLLIVGERDTHVLALNRQAMQHLHAPTQLEVVAGASHLFEEPGALARVSACAITWLKNQLSEGSQA